MLEENISTEEVIVWVLILNVFLSVSVQLIGQLSRNKSFVTQKTASSTAGETNTTSTVTPTTTSAASNTTTPAGNSTTVTPDSSSLSFSASVVVLIISFLL